MAYQAVASKEPEYNFIKREDLEVGTSLSGNEFECAEVVVGKKKLVLIRKRDPRRYELRISDPQKGLLAVSLPKGPDEVSKTDIKYLRREFPNANFSSVFEKLDEGAHGSQ